MPKRNARNTHRNSYSLHFGFNYPKTDYQLNGCYNDARMMKSAAKILGVSNSKVILDRKHISKDEILNHITNFINKPDGSKLFLTYSGHGASVKGNDLGERDNKNEALVAPSGDLILDDEMFSILQKLPPKSTLFIILDCCHSGTGCDFPLMLKGKKWTVDRQDNLSDRQNGAIMLSGCTDSQYSYERVVDNKVRGALTNAFYNTIISKFNRHKRRQRKKFKRRNRKQRRNILKISYYKLLQDIRRKIKDPKQTPLLSATNYINPFVSVFGH